VNEDAARKRVARGLEKLRKLFGKRGVTLTATVIASVVGANSVQAAPVGLAVKISVIAAKGAATTTSITALVKGSLKIMAWAKAKMAITITAGVLLATGTTTVVVEEMKRPYISDEMWMVDSQGIKNLPPVLILRPTQFDKMGGLSLDGRYVYRDFPLWLICQIAYPEFASVRSLHSDLLPAAGYDWSKPAQPKLTNGFDLMLTLTNQPVEALRQKIKKQFGVAAHIETIETNVLLLKMKKFPASGLSYGDKNTHWFDRGGIVPCGYTITNAVGLGNLASWLEGMLQIPVLDQTGPKEVYNVSLQYDPQELLRRMEKQGFDRRQQIEADLIREAVAEQLGLELVPSLEPIEMLVVEKVK
jgi:hypothetical protein